MLDTLLQAISPSHAVQVLAVLGLLSAIKALIAAFGNQDNKVIKVVGAVLDFVGFNPKH